MKLSALVPPPGKSKYELSIVAAREARRLNDWIRRSGETLHGKVTAVALERVIHDDVPYYYEDPQALLAQPVEPMADPLADPLAEPTLE
jgi:DNA-directed RNA polymerase subunit K/omega